MTTILESARALRPAQRLPFCYLCGATVVANDACDRDHVPPKAVFAVEDRSPPLILRTHRHCNSGRSAEDQVISQLVGVLHGRSPEESQNKLILLAGHFSDGSPAIAGEIGLRAIIQRWVRGFHAALYGEPLSQEVCFMTSAPLPEARIGANGIEEVPVPRVVPMFVEVLKRSRVARTVDRVVCFNQKCRYECVWTATDDGHPLCIYGLDLYGWKALGDSDHFQPRGCVGAYVPLGRSAPRHAAVASKLHFSVGNIDPLDPFGP